MEIKFYHIHGSHPHSWGEDSMGVYPMGPSKNSAYHSMPSLICICCADEETEADKREVSIQPHVVIRDWPGINYLFLFSLPFFLVQEIEPRDVLPLSYIPVLFLSFFINFFRQGLTKLLRVASRLHSSCFGLQTTEIMGVHHHTWSLPMFSGLYSKAFWGLWA